ncbi:MAG: hypothetical protein A2126_01405 [Candidatus Woykebacteria bacterium GWB1_45_5]|uniref:Uncharacterized protein n=1 Tax=Candidatus Woykebacteria bacterium GWB1_45_5 TaxID=1802592 RepID=A0A1G1W7Y7_9BACT|nr:MAG: hypothetical protein A2126_01405 [Candidatus Woykebacteria bacterium GWB1_45_5]
MEIAPASLPNRSTPDRRTATIASIVLTTFFSLGIAFLFYFLFGYTNVSDRLVANTIPRYPNAANWRFSSGYETNDMTIIWRQSIYFDTSDTAKSILDFYQEELTGRGWKLVKEESEGNLVWFKTFKRIFSGRDFYLRVGKIQDITGQSNFSVGKEITEEPQRASIVVSSREKPSGL